MRAASLMGVLLALVLCLAADAKADPANKAANQVPVGNGKTSTQGRTARIERLTAAAVNFGDILREGE